MKLAQLLSTAALVAAIAAPLSAHAQGDTSKPKPKGATQAAATAMPTAATARCGDGTWSLAATSQGACSGHGGVAKWFGAAPAAATARCKDGEYWTNAGMQGACSGHGGIAFKISPKQRSHQPKPS